MRIVAIIFGILAAIVDLILVMAKSPIITRRRRRSSRRTRLSAEPEAVLASVSALRRACR